MTAQRRTSHSSPSKEWKAEITGTTVRHFARWRTGIIALALIVHLAFSFLHYAEPQADAAEYHALATELALHHTFGLSTDGETAVRPTARRMPLYPLLLAGIYRAAGIEQGLYGAPLVQALLMVCNVALTIAIARRFFGDATALLAGLLVCFYQGYLYLPTELLSENLAIPLLLLTLWLLTCATRHRALTLIAAFVTFGLLVLTRANALILLPVLLVWTWRTLRGQRRQALKITALAACFVITLAPWWLRNAIVFERFVPLTTSGGWNFYLGHNDVYARSPGLGQGTDYAIFDRLIASGLTEPEADRELYARGLAYARAHPAETAT